MIAPALLVIGTLYSVTSMLFNLGVLVGVSNSLLTRDL